MTRYELLVKAAELIAAMKEADNDDVRGAILNEIHDNFCVHCGSLDPRCQCWNDE